MNHQQLVEAAKAAINAVFSDRTVSAETTLESLEELSADVETNIGAIKADLQKGGE